MEIKSFAGLLLTSYGSFVNIGPFTGLLWQLPFDILIRFQVNSKNPSILIKQVVKTNNGTIKKSSFKLGSISIFYIQVQHLSYFYTNYQHFYSLSIISSPNIFPHIKHSTFPNNFKIIQQHKLLNKIMLNEKAQQEAI